MSDKVILLDNNFISHLHSAGGPGAWDLIFNVGSKVVITDLIVKEIEDAHAGFTSQVQF